MGLPAAPKSASAPEAVKSGQGAEEHGNCPRCGGELQRIRYGYYDNFYLCCWVLHDNYVCPQCGFKRFEAHYYRYPEEFFEEYER
jgi:transposase-like protein